MFKPDSKVYEGSITRLQFGPAVVPYEFSGPRDEYLACRRSAWLGIALNTTPIYDVTGPDAEKLFNHVCVNKDFRLMQVGSSKHALMCNEKGQMLADGVIMKLEDNLFRTYWMAPVLQYYVQTCGLDVHGEYRTDEFFFQLDGPKSLEILEEATGSDLHGLKFAHNTKSTIAGKEVVIHRLGMSGALAYEIHGNMDEVEEVYEVLRGLVFRYDGRLQGFRNYCTVNHTPAGYPNQNIHFIYPYYTSGEGLAKFAEMVHPNESVIGSASDDKENAYSTPYDVGWGYLVNYDHDFIGKEALKKIKENPPYKLVTLEWNADDVADVFKSQFTGTDTPMYEPIEYFSGFDDMSQLFAIHADYVLDGEKKIGVATGKTYAYYEHRMISLAKIDPAYAAEGTAVTVLWGTPGYPQKKIRAVVARTPYYQGEFRNETCDVEKLVPHRK